MVTMLVERPTARGSMDLDPGLAAVSDGLSAAELQELRHEVLNALTTVAAYAQLLLRRESAEANETQRRALLAIESGVQRACHLLRETRTPDVPHRVDISSLLMDAINQIRPERFDDVRVTYLTDQALVGRWHPDRVAQTLANLLDNAAKYSPVGTPIEIELSRDAAWVRVAVRDSGIGIEPQDIKSIFDGYRSDLARLTASGSGLGLQLSRRLVEAEGGRLWAISTPGTGSTFYLELPAISPAL